MEYVQNAAAGTAPLTPLRPCATHTLHYRCKLLVVGGGSGGCTIAAKFARRLQKDAVIVLEPSDVHYYQPLWTLVAAGVTSVASTRRSARSVLPSQARWLRDSASSVDPARQAVVTTNGTSSTMNTS
ncbi:hypothetical protein MSG28_004324 [Choristoneura fumiferana]|uniref:Uncharacterized protein n=1 Tax=Choristoneura fumiferana TaxID=7141 RepID=A0ACC0KIF0_CHOFU|nr:hypothetical protein MSG28_004324 [Choristoneura fumiferana]